MSFGVCARRHAQAVFLLLFIFYPMVALRIFRLFRCKLVEGKRYLVVDMRLECYTPLWWAVAVYAFVMLGLFGT